VPARWCEAEVERIAHGIEPLPGQAPAIAVLSKPKNGACLLVEAEMMRDRSAERAQETDGRSAAGGGEIFQGVGFRLDGATCETHVNNWLIRPQTSAETRKP